MIDKAALKAEAFRLGFWLCGVTTPEPPPHLDTYNAWITAGRHADMAYLATPRALACRAKPDTLLPDCQTIIVLAAPYPAPPASVSANTAHNRWLCEVNRLPQRLSSAAGSSRGLDHPARGSPPPMARLHRFCPHPGKRTGPARRSGLDRQKHQSHQPGNWFIPSCWRNFSSTLISNPIPPLLPTAAVPAPAVWMPAPQPASCPTARLMPPVVCLT